MFVATNFLPHFQFNSQFIGQNGTHRMAEYRMAEEHKSLTKYINNNEIKNEFRFSPFLTGDYVAVRIYHFIRHIRLAQVS